MNKWLQLSEGFYLFGPGGVVRFETTTVYSTNGTPTKYTMLFSERGKMTSVTNSLDEIQKLLYTGNKDDK